MMDKVYLLNPFFNIMHDNFFFKYIGLEHLKKKLLKAATQ